MLVRRGWRHFSRTLALGGIILFLLGLIFVDYRIIGDLAARLAFGTAAAIAILGLASRRWRISVGLAAIVGILGAASYPLYLVHPAVETVVIHMLIKFGKRAAVARDIDGSVGVFRGSWRRAFRVWRGAAVEPDPSRTSLTFACPDCSSTSLAPTLFVAGELIHALMWLSLRSLARSTGPTGSKITRHGWWLVLGAS